MPCYLLHQVYLPSRSHFDTIVPLFFSHVSLIKFSSPVIIISCDYVYKEFSYVNNGYHANGKLSVNGADLVNQFGEKYQLYGLSTHGIQWFSKVVNFDTICEIQENFGNNIIRFALYTDENGYCDGSEATKKMMLETS